MREARLGCGLQHVEAAEENEQQDRQHRRCSALRHSTAGPAAPKPIKTDRRQKHGTQVAAPLQREQGGAHDDDHAGHGYQCRQVDLPVVLASAAPVSAASGHHEHRHLHHVQRKDAEWRRRNSGLRNTLELRYRDGSASEWKRLV